MTLTCKNIGGCDKYNVGRKKYSPKESEEKILVCDTHTQRSQKHEKR